MTQWPETQEFPTLCVPFFPLSCANVLSVHEHTCSASLTLSAFLQKLFLQLPGTRLVFLIAPFLQLLD